MQPMISYKLLYVMRPLLWIALNSLQGFHLSVEKSTRYIATGTSGRKSIVHVWVSSPMPVAEPPAEPVAESPAPAPETSPGGPVKVLNSTLRRLC